MKKIAFFTIALLILSVLWSGCGQDKQAAQWSKDRINQWYSNQDWLVGMNYIPRTAINPIEMWQEETFDPKIIDQELGWAEELGFNSVRVYLNHLVWQKDSSAYVQRLDHFLDIANRHGIRTMFVFFDAVWQPYSSTGPQPEPVPHVHNSGWVQCPDQETLKDTANYDNLKRYVQHIGRTFAGDSRVVIWDMYNEPGNHNGGRFEEIENKDLYVFMLLERSFEWMREIDPSQPLTAAPWIGDWSDTSKLSNFNEFMLKHSDIVSFHGYDEPGKFKDKVAWLKVWERPMVCTEYMSRKTGNTFENLLPFMKENNIGAYNWGFVSGKTQTIYPWDSWYEDYTSEPEMWFHDILREDGTPYDSSETRLIRSLTGESES